MLRLLHVNTVSTIFGVFFFQILASSNVEADFDGNIEDADTTTYLSKVLKPNGLYSFRVAAVNGFGNGDFSPNVTYRANFSGML